MVVVRSLRIGGAALDAAIAASIRHAHGIRMADGEAERLKITIGAAVPVADDAVLEVDGSDGEGRPQRVRISGAEVRAAIAEPLEAIAAGVGQLIQEAPEPARESVQRTGVTLTGGGALLRGLADFLAQRISVPVRVATNPQVSVAAGAGLALENFHLLKGGQHYIT
jgi:rod shape-determining protein MreB